MIKQIVNRCHIADSNRSVIRYVISRLKDGYTTWRALAREQRRLVMAWCVWIHAENRALYRSVTRGNQ